MKIIKSFLILVLLVSINAYAAGSNSASKVKVLTDCQPHPYGQYQLEYCFVTGYVYVESGNYSQYQFNSRGYITSFYESSWYSEGSKAKTICGESFENISSEHSNAKESCEMKHKTIQVQIEIQPEGGNIDISNTREMR